MNDLTRGGVLLVDDVADLRRVVARMLRGVGYYVAEADSGAAALRLLGVDPLPDLVISDVMMPGMDGIELLRAIRGDARTAGVPVIMFSANTEAAEIAAALAEGASAYWVKGQVHVEQIVAEVDRVIALGRAGLPVPMGHEPTLQRKPDPDPA